MAAREFTDVEKQIIELRSNIARSGGFFEHKDLQKSGVSPSEFPAASANALARVKNGRAGKSCGGLKHAE